MKSLRGRGRKGELRICYFGTYLMEEGYPRSRVIIEGLRKNGIAVAECHEDFWRSTEEKLEGVKTVSIIAMLKSISRLFRAYKSLFCKFREVGAYDAMIVGYAGHLDIFFARVLNIFRRRPILFDAFLSLYDTAVMDRRIVSPGSMKAKLLWVMDRWSCRMADAVLLDTPAHLDYFVREFRLPAEKFHAIPVGSYLAPLETCSDNSPSPQIPLNPPLLKGEIGGFTVLYFGSYIPLHGVDVILKAAKIIQDEGNGLPSVIPAQAGIQNAGRGLDSHLRGNDGKLEGFADEKVMVFTLVGTGQLLPEMKALASSLGLKNVIFIDRFVSEEELVGYIREADVCLGIFGQTDKAARVIPCKVYNCLAMGKPLITMSSQATEGVLTHRENAFLSRPGDPDDLANSIVELRNDARLRKKIGANGYQYFENNFSAEAIGKRVLNIITSTLKGA